MMKVVASYDSALPLVVAERPIPSPGDGEVLIRVERSGICGSDLRRRKAPHQVHRRGLVMGHEFSGQIVDVGRGVDRARIGARIAAYPGAGCGACTMCRNDYPVLCPHGHHIMGGFAEMTALPAACAIPLPDDMDAVLGALVEPMAVGRHAVRIAGLAPGDAILVLGGGSIALSVIFWARRMNAGRITAVLRSGYRAPLARQMGADDILLTDAPEEAHTNGPAFAAVFECTGAPAMLDPAIACCAPFGKVLSLGCSRLPETIVPASAGGKAVSLHFPTGYATRDFVETAATLHEGPVDARAIVSDTVPLGELPDMFEALLKPNRFGKVQIAF
jgi:(R,R)-butanediol dehydrogenase/meso-butanediol dehydrogenase/diacetyl reductase